MRGCGKNAVAVALAALLGAAAVAQVAPAEPLADASVEQLRDLLAGGGSKLQSRAFRRTAPPSTDGLCPGDEAFAAPAAAPGAGTRNLVAVPFAGDSAPRVDLAIAFAHNSDALAPEGRALLAKLGAALKDPQLRDDRFAVAGHTDATGPDRVNLELSCARALAVKRFLVAGGVPADRLSAYGFGSGRPIERDAVASARNRRVEIRRVERTQP